MRNSSYIVGSLLWALILVGHLVGQADPTTLVQWGRTPVTTEKVTATLREFATKNEKHGPFQRKAAFEIAYPETIDELNQLGGNAVLMVTAMTPDQNRFPPAKVFARFGDEEVDLILVDAVYSRSEGEPDKVVSVLGRFRMDALYLLPMALRFKPGLTLSIRFANEKNGGLVFGGFDGPLPARLKGFVNREPATGKYSEATLKAFVVRKFPGFYRDR